MIYYFQKGIQSLKIEISKILFNPSINEKTEKFNKTFSIKKIEKISTSDKGNQIIKYKMKGKGENPPKKIENSNNIIISKNIRNNMNNIYNNKINEKINTNNNIGEKELDSQKEYLSPDYYQSNKNKKNLFLQ